MTHSEARKPSQIPIQPLSLEEFRMKQLPQPVRSLDILQAEAAKLVSMRATLEQAMPGMADAMSGSELQLMGMFSDAEKAFRARLKPGSRQERDWLKFIVSLQGRSAYVSQKVTQDAPTDLDWLQANGMAVEIVETLEKKRVDPLYAHVRAHLSNFVTMSLRALENKQIEEMGMTSLDIRSADEFLSKHSLVDFFSSITNVDVDSNDGNSSNARDLMSEFLLMYIRNRDLLTKAPVTTNLEQERRATKQAMKGLVAVENLRKMASGAIVDPTHPDHAELASKFLKDTVRAKANRVFTAHLARIMYGGEDLVPTYRAAFAHLKNGDEPELYQAILDLASSVNTQEGRYLFINEAMDLQIGPAKEKEELKGMQDVAASVGRILPGSSKASYSVDVERVADWNGFRKPDSVAVDLDKRFPTEVSVQLSYAEGDEAKQLQVFMDTRKKDVQWSILEPASAYPDFADQLVHVTAEILEALEQTVQRPARPEVILFQNNTVKRPGQRGVHEHHRPHAEAAPREMIPGEASTTVEAHRRAGSVYMSYDPEELREMCEHLSAVDQQRIKPMLDRFNEDGLGFFKIFKGRIGGKRIGEVRLGDIRVLGIEEKVASEKQKAKTKLDGEEEASDNKQRFKARKVLYKGAVKDREWKLL